MDRQRASVFLLASAVLLAAAVGVTAVALHPHALADATSPAVMVATALLLAAYAGYAWRATRVPRTSSLAVPFGLTAAVCWAIEIWAGGPALLSRPVERAVGGTFALAATALTVAAGITTALRTRDRAAAWRTGLLAGAISGALLYAVSVVMTLVTLDRLGGRADYRGQYASSHHLPTMTDFLVNDILGAAAAHLVINALLGLVGAALGWLIITASYDAGSAPKRTTNVGGS